MSNFTNTIIIGAGQAGLAMSRNLTDRSISHVVFERGEIANAWRTERWDSLRLLTPNWMTRLPNWKYTGADPDGYMTMPEVADYMADFADSFDAPVLQNTTVTNVEPMGGGYPGYKVDTDGGSWFARSVVLATGACNRPRVPAWASKLGSNITQITPKTYRNPGQLPSGGVLVVGAAASGVQIAHELANAGKDVTLAVGRHIRLPRNYRGMDIQWWLDASGLLDRRWDEIDDLKKARRQPSLQIVGTPEHTTLDLSTLLNQGVRLTGRVEDIEGSKVTFADDLASTCDQADRQLARILSMLDRYAVDAGIDAGVRPAERFSSTPVPVAPKAIDLEGEGITTVLWATGFTPDYPWLNARVFDDRGEIDHEGGVVNGAPGMYVLGLPFMRRRRSTFIDGAAGDAAALADHLAGHLDREPLVV